MDTSVLRPQFCPRLAIALTLWTWGATTAVFADEPKVRFDLPAESCPQALLDFYHQTNIGVLFLATRALAHVTTNPVVGDFSPADGLVRMLQGTPVSFEFDADKSIIVSYTYPSVEARDLDIESTKPVDAHALPAPREHQRKRKLSGDSQPRPVQASMAAISQDSTGRKLAGVRYGDIEQSSKWARPIPELADLGKAGTPPQPYVSQ